MNLLASGLIELLLFAGLKRNPSEAGEHSRYLSGIRVVSTVRTPVFQPSSQGIPFGRHSTSARSLWSRTTCGSCIPGVRQIPDHSFAVREYTSNTRPFHGFA